MGSEVHRKPTARRGLSCVRLVLSAGWLHAGDFDFKAAKVWMEILADAVCNIDAGASRETKLRGAAGHVPPYGACCCRAVILREFEA